MTCATFFASGLMMAGCDVVTVQRPKAEDRIRAAAAGLMQQVGESATTTDDE